MVTEKGSDRASRQVHAFHVLSAFWMLRRPLAWSWTPSPPMGSLVSQCHSANTTHTALWRQEEAPSGCAWQSRAAAGLGRVRARTHLSGTPRRRVPLTQRTGHPATAQIHSPSISSHFPKPFLSEQNEFPLALPLNTFSSLGQKKKSARTPFPVLWY